MVLIVQKFGGIFVGIVECIEQVVEKVKKFCEVGDDVVVVVFVMSGEINCLIGLVNQIMEQLVLCELDVMVLIGEQVIIVLFSMVLIKCGVLVVFYIGNQVCIFIDSVYIKVCILYIDDIYICVDFKVGRVVVVVGFQGVDGNGNIIMLGCGGFDIIGVVLVVVLKVDECQIYIDVDGVYIIDLCVVLQVCWLDKIIFEEMLEMVSFGFKVLQIWVVEFVGKYNVLLCVLYSFQEGLGIFIIIDDEEEFMEQLIIFGIVFNCDEVKLIICGVFDIFGVVFKIFGLISVVNVEVDMIVQNVVYDNIIDFIFMVYCNDYLNVLEIFKQIVVNIGVCEVIGDINIVKVFIVGVGMCLYVGVVSCMFEVLVKESINIQMIFILEIKVFVVIEEKYLELVVCVLYMVFEFDVLV